MKIKMNYQGPTLKRLPKAGKLEGLGDASRFAQHPLNTIP
jgi:hypothetical protein